MFQLLLVALLISVAFLIGLTIYVIRDRREARRDIREAKSDARIAREQSDSYMKAMESIVGGSVRNPDVGGPEGGIRLHSVADAAPGVIDRVRDVARRNPSSAAALILIAAGCAYSALTLLGHAPGDGPMALQLPDRPSPIPTTPALASDPVPMSDPQPSTAAQPSVTPTPAATVVSFAVSTRQPSPSAPPEAQPVPPPSPPSSPNPTTSTPLKVCVPGVQVAGAVQSPCVAR